MDALFSQAVAHVSRPPSTTQVSDEVRLRFYGLYKQATEGPLRNRIPRPSLLNYKARAKWDAWTACREMGPSQAKQLYVSRLAATNPGWTEKK